MTHDFSKPPHVQTPEERQKKKRVPVYMLALVGIFFIALLLYMFADRQPNKANAPPGHPNATTAVASSNNTATTTTSDEAVATDSNTATATDR